MRLNRPSYCVCVLVATAWLAADPIAAQQAAPTTTSAPASRPDATLTLAVLDFAADAPAQPELGKQISETLAILLSGEGGIRVVDRASMQRTLQEQELNLTGVVESTQAVKIGRLVGARLLLTGKAFRMGEKLYITAKLIGVETSLLDGVIETGNATADVGELTISLGAKLAARIREVGPKLVAREDAGIDPIPGLKARLQDKKRPVAAVIVSERHLNVRGGPLPDPAVETEIKKLLIECGFTIKDVAANELTDFVRAAGPGGAWPRGLDGVELVVAGEGLSEFSSRIGNLVSCAARVEINVISRADGRIVLSDRTTERGVDLSENVAAKKALEKAGRLLGVHILTHLATDLPFADKGK